MGAACARAIDRDGARAGAPSTKRAPPGPHALPARSILKSSSIAGELASARDSHSTGTAASSAATTPCGSERDLEGRERGMTRKVSLVKFAGLSDDEEEEHGEGWRGRLFGGRAVASGGGGGGGERDDDGATTTHGNGFESDSSGREVGGGTIYGMPTHERRGSFTSSVPVVEHEEEAHWFLSIGVDTRLAAARVMESRLAAARVEEERLRELVIEAEAARREAEAEARAKSEGEHDEPRAGSSGGDSGEDDGAVVSTPPRVKTATLMPWDVMVTVARAREGDARAAAHKATLVVKKLAHTVALWELKSTKRARSDIGEHLTKIKEKKGRRLASATRARATFIAAEETRDREFENTRVLEDKRLAADVNMAEASARIHAARTALQNARDRKKGILTTFRQAVRTSMDSSVDLLEFRQKEFALRASNVTKTMFTAYDEMTSRLEEALMNAIDAVGRKSPKKIDKVFDIEAAAALTARDRAEASLNDATSQCMAEMRALEASTRTLLDDVDEEIKNGIEEYYAAADDERVCYMEAQRATIACKMAHAAVKVYEEQYNATKNMSDEAHTWASSLDDEIAQLNKDYAIAEERHLEAAKVVDAALVEVEAAEKDVLSTSAPDESNQKSARRQSVRNVFEVINRFSTMVRDKSARGDSDTFVSLKQLSLQAGSDSPRNSDEQHRVSMLGFSTSFPDADATMESIMEKAHELEHSRDVQTLTRNVSRSAMAYNPLQK
jgi:hypothetical protein